MNRWHVLAAVVLSIIGLIINSAVDVDNVYDMMLVGLRALTFNVSILCLLLGGGWNARGPSREKFLKECRLISPLQLVVTTILFTNHNL